MGVVLAAGGSTRFGGFKLLHPVGGRPMVWWAAEALRGAGLEVFLVVGPRAGEVAAAAGPARAIFNPWWEAGLSTSVKAAVSALLDRPCLVLALGDMPAVRPSTVEALLRAPPGGLVFPAYGGRRGNPVVAHRDVYPHALALEGDVGLRALLGRVPHREVEVDDPGVLADVDRREDLEALLPLLRAASEEGLDGPP